MHMAFFFPAASHGQACTYDLNAWVKPGASLLSEPMSAIIVSGFVNIHQ
jgi:hypothetical protein